MKYFESGILFLKLLFLNSDVIIMFGEIRAFIEIYRTKLLVQCCLDCSKSPIRASCGSRTELFVLPYWDSCYGSNLFPQQVTVYCFQPKH